VRLLRLLRLGDLGALCDDWAGWTLNRLGLHDPAGRTYRLDAMRAWWITAEQARFWRQGHRLPCGSERLEGASSFAPAASGQGEAPRRETARPDQHRHTAAPANRSSSGASAAAIARLGVTGQPASRTGGEAGACDRRRAGAAGRQGVRQAPGAARSAPAGAGLVSSLKQVRSQGLKPKQDKASQGFPDAR
jgi:hypothetical protein